MHGAAARQAIPLALAGILFASAAAAQARRDGPAEEQGSAGTGLSLLAKSDPAALPAAMTPAPIALRSRRAPLPELQSRTWTEANSFAVGSFNPMVTIHLHDGTPVASHNKSSAGVGTEYRHWLGDRYAVGLLYERNASDGRLQTPVGYMASDLSIWPATRYGIYALATEKMRSGRFAPYVCEGPGVVLTNGGSNSGWSSDFGVVAGLGGNYQIRPRFSLRGGVNFLDVKSGCYGDGTCHAAWGVTKEVHAGIAYRWQSRRAPGVGWFR